MAAIQSGFKLLKSLGQNILTDANITEKIVRLSGIDKSCGVLEVGPGFGALTEPLADAAGFVTAVELDGRLIPILREHFAGRDNLRIVRGDIMKLDIKELLAAEETARLEKHVCANLPYNITTPVITAFIVSGIFVSMTLMVQREVARRICAEPGSGDYGAFSVYARYHTEPEILFDVPPGCFVPPPAVWSSVIRLRPWAERMLTEPHEKMFFTVVRAAFGQRRKTLVNALQPAFAGRLTKEDIADAVEQCGFDARIRGEALGVGDFARLAEVLLY